MLAGRDSSASGVFSRTVPGLSVRRHRGTVPEKSSYSYEEEKRVSDISGTQPERASPDDSGERWGAGGLPTFRKR